MTTIINQEVTIDAFYFAGSEMKTFPRQIELDGQAVTFASGLRYLVQRGQQAIRYFDMSNDENGLTYRLRQDGSQWMLLGTKGAL